MKKVSCTFLHFILMSRLSNIFPSLLLQKTVKRTLSMARMMTWTTTPRMPTMTTMATTTLPLTMTQKPCCPKWSLRLHGKLLQKNQPGMMRMIILCLPPMPSRLQSPPTSPSRQLTSHGHLLHDGVHDYANVVIQVNGMMGKGESEVRVAKDGHSLTFVCTIQPRSFDKKFWKR